MSITRVYKRLPDKEKIRFFDMLVEEVREEIDGNDSVIIITIRDTKEVRVRKGLRYRDNTRLLILSG